MLRGMRKCVHQNAEARFQDIVDNDAAQTGVASSAAANAETSRQAAGGSAPSSSSGPALAAGGDAPEDCQHRCDFRMLSITADELGGTDVGG